MKHTLATAFAALLLAASSYGQGTLFFSNKHGTVDAPVLADAGGKISGPNYMAQLYAGPVGGALAAIGDPAPFYPTSVTAAQGYWKAADTTRIVPGVAPGAQAAVQILVYDSTKFATADLAKASLGSPGTGQSAVFNVTTGGVGTPPNLPQDLVGLTGFTVSTVPEPTVLALGAIGGLALLLRRRKA
jgi:hypothetical protein